MRFIRKLITWMVVGLVSIFLCAVIIFSFLEPGCDENSTQANYARSISEERLAKLFDQLKTIKLADDLIRNDSSKYREVNFPEGIKVPYEFSPKELQDLSFFNVLISKRHSRLMLQGCFDHFLTLNIQGLYGEEKPKITLNWGAVSNESETLWER